MRRACRLGHSPCLLSYLGNMVTWLHALHASLVGHSEYPVLDMFLHHIRADALSPEDLSHKAALGCKNIGGQAQRL